VGSIPVRLNGPGSIRPLLEGVRERTNRRTYQNFVDRGAVHGHDLDDWLEAESELTIKPEAEIRAEGADVFVEVLLAAEHPDRWSMSRCYQNRCGTHQNPT
jgi:Protein of unknown function (DUF2934)